MSSYHHRQPYLHPWTGQAMYPQTAPSAVDTGPPLHYMYHGFGHPQMQGHPPVMQTVGNSGRMLNPAIINMEYTMPGGLQANITNPSAPQRKYPHGPSTSQLSASLGREGSSGGSGGTGYGAPTEASATGLQQQTSTMAMQNPDAPYFVPGSVPWTAWRGAPTLSPFPFPLDGTNQSTPVPYAHGNDIIRTDTASPSTKTSTEVVDYGVSKKTLQRRAQRDRKNAFKARSEQWPMAIQCTPKGELPLDVRNHVHTQFRATARRFLNLSVIKFRDHPDTDIKVMKDDLEKRFTFDPPLRSDYVLFYIESALRTARYVWRKHWIQTGRGERHKMCPLRFFQALVCYWRTKEADDEARLLREERDAKRKQRELRSSSDDGDGEQELEWDVRSSYLRKCCALIDYLLWIGLVYVFAWILGRFDVN